MYENKNDFKIEFNDVLPEDVDSNNKFNFGKIFLGHANNFQKLLFKLI